ncbi:MAG: GxxExxY protein [Pseudomonadota bacterium]
MTNTKDTEKCTKGTKENTRFDELSGKVIGCAIEVHRALGPGLFESAYSQCLLHELVLSKLAVEAEVALPIRCKNIEVPAGYRIDLLVENILILELKSVERLLPVHEAQLLTYMRLSGVRTGLLINFNTRRLKEGIKRYGI